MLLIIFLIIIECLLMIVNGDQFTIYHKYSNLTLADQYKPLFQIRESFQVGQYNPAAKCMLACNNEPNCNLLTVDGTNHCTLFNNQTTLIHMASAIDIKLYSKVELKMCFDGFYADLTASVCRAQKTFSIDCLSSNECLNLLGLQCFNSTCQCPLDSK